MKLTQATVIFTLFGLCFTGARTAHAAISLTETGDFSNNAASPFIVPQPLGIGVNTISGSLPPPTDSRYLDYDYFTIRNPVGHLVAAVNLTISSYGGPAGASGVLEIFSLNPNTLSFSSNGTFSLPVTLINSSDLTFRLSGLAYNSSSFPYAPYTGGSSNYTLSVVVPEPSSTLLIALGIAGVALSGRKHGGMTLGRS